MPLGKTIYLLRHAMTVPSSSTGDKERELTPKGKEDAALLGKIMRKENYTPAFALCSPARRTKETLAAISASVDIRKTLYPDNLYNGSANDLLFEIMKAPEEERDILLVAHNPAIHAITAQLARDGAESLLQRLAGAYHPGTLSVLECPCESWTEIETSQNKLTALLDPIDYNASPRPTRWT